MANENFVRVEQSLFKRLCDHSDHCDSFPWELQASPDGWAVLAPSRPKRKAATRTTSEEVVEPRKRTKHATQALNWFLANAPKKIQWRNKQIELGLRTAEQYEEVVRSLCHGTSIKLQTSQQDSNCTDELVSLATKFSLVVKESLLNSELQKSVSRFQVLVLLSYCQVLRDKGIPYEIIDSVIKHISPQEKYRKALVNTALWINGIINQLVGAKWTIHQATELFFISPLSVHNLRGICDQENEERILEYFTADDSLQYSYQNCLKPGFTIPGLIAFLVKTSNIDPGRLSFNEICHALRYSPEDIADPSSDVFKVHAPTGRTTLCWESTLRSMPTPTTLGDSSPTTRAFLLLLDSLGSPTVAKRILSVALQPRSMWDADGDIRTVTIFESGLDPHYADLFASKEQLDCVIELCLRSKMLISNGLKDEALAYFPSAKLKVQPFYIERDESDLSLQIVILTAHIYPREESLHDSFNDTGRLLLPILDRCWKYVLEEPGVCLSACVRESLVEATLAASKFDNGSYVSRLEAVITHFQQESLPDHLLLAITSRQSVKLRSKGKHDESDILIENILRKTTAQDVRHHCLHGRLYLSLTENAILRKDFAKAAFHLDKWEAKNNEEPSLFELQVIRQKNTALGRLWRYQGDFVLARQYLNTCLKPVRPETSRYHVIHHLADIHCELEIPDAAAKLIEADIIELKVRKRLRSKAYRRLMLPLAESDIQRQRYAEAKATLLLLNNVFRELTNPNISDQLNHVRSELGLIRIAIAESNWQEALDCSEYALDLTRRYKTFSKGNFYIGVIYLFRALIYHELGRPLQSGEASSRADRCDPGPWHFMPGIGTYVLRQLKSTLIAIQPAAT